MKSRKCSISVLWVSYQQVCDQGFQAYSWGYVNETLRIVSMKTEISSAILNGSIVIGKKTFAGRSVLCQERHSEN